MYSVWGLEIVFHKITEENLKFWVEINSPVFLLLYEISVLTHRKSSVPHNKAQKPKILWKLKN